MDISRIIEANISSFKGSKTQQNAAGVFLLKLFSTTLTFVTAILIARLTGSAGYGAYNFAISWIAILSLIGLFGFNKLIVREYARYQTDLNYGLQLGLLRRAEQLTVLFSLAVIAVVWMLSDYIGQLVVEEDSSLMVNSLLVALPLVVILTLIRIRQAAMEANRQAFVGNMAELLISPMALLVFVIIFWLALNDQFNAFWALGGKVAAGIVAFVSLAVIARRNLPEAIRKAKPEYCTRKWLKSAFPLLLISGLYVVNANTDIIMIGFLGGADATGYYAAASKAALLMTFIMLSVNKTLSPNFASLYKEQKIERLQSLVTHSVRVVSFVSGLSMLALVGLGYWYLLIFGSDFTIAHFALAILCFAKLINGLMGPVGHLLIMTSHENIAAWNVALAVVVNIVLNYLLIPIMGIEGAAVSSLVSFIVVNVLQATAVYRLVGINPTIFRFRS